MSITTTGLSFFFKNIQKSHAAVSTYLNEFSDGPYNFLFFQEIQGKTYRHVADINHLQGLEVFGLPIHPDWICLLAPACDSQIVVYYHKHIAAHFHITVNHNIFHHPNILLFSLFNPVDHSTLYFINLYQNPSRSAPSHLRHTVPCLLQFLLLLPSVRLIQGDFNIHCSYWDPNVKHDDPLGWSVINALTALGLSLVNNEGEHTFFHANNRPQVLDLVWLHEDVSLPLTINISFSITGATSDHHALLLLCRD